MTKHGKISASGNGCLIETELIEINQHHRTIKELAERALDHARSAGELLAKAKASLPHGQFGKWVANHCEFSDRTARTYILVAERWDDITVKRKRFRNLSVRSAVKLVSHRNDPISNALAGPHTPFDWEPPTQFLAIGKASDGRYVLLEGQDDRHVRIGCMDDCGVTYMKRGILRHLLVYVLTHQYGVKPSEVDWFGHLLAVPLNNPLAEFMPEWQSGVPV